MEWRGWLVLVFKLTANMEESVTSLDVGKEGIPKSLSSCCSLDQPRNVNHVQKCRDFAEIKQQQKSISFQIQPTRYEKRLEIHVGGIQSLISVSISVI